MQDPQSLDPANRELAEALEGLRLAPTKIDQRDIWYQAGLQAGRKRNHAWQSAAAIMTLAVGALGIHAVTARPTFVDRVVYVHPQNPPAMAAIYSRDAQGSPEVSAANLRLRNAVLVNGLSALPTSADGDDQGTVLRPGAPLP